MSGAHTNLARHEHISSRDIDRWQLHDQESLQSIQTHLLGVVGKTAREKAETQLGWNLKEMTEGVVLNPFLQNILPLTNILYDPMHCWASNGLIGQEAGYWYTALCQKKHGHAATISIILQNLLDSLQWPLGRHRPAASRQTLASRERLQRRSLMLFGHFAAHACLFA